MRMSLVVGKAGLMKVRAATKMFKAADKAFS